MRLFGRRRRERQEHEEVDRRLSNQEKRTQDMQQRVERLERERGIFRPPLREAGDR